MNLEVIMINEINQTQMDPIPYESILYEVPGVVKFKDRKLNGGPQGQSGENGLFNGYRISVLQGTIYSKFWLYNNVNILNNIIT